MGNRYMKTPLVRKGWIWLGILILIGGGALTWHYHEHPPPNMREHNLLFFRCLIGTILLSGLCFICGTAQWWLKK